MKKILIVLFSLIFILPNYSCHLLKKNFENDNHYNKSKLEINNYFYTLDNGLKVVLHQDKSDPVVALSIMYHVGSAREKKGKTGFAHLFEHMLFQRSENVGEDQFFKIVQSLGGNLNGFTWNDGTMYFEVVPKNALETILWLESDRMGFFINSVTKSSFENQKNVVQNEKRQRYDNSPYGHQYYVLDKLIYPENHPYNWQTIGEMKDLKNATLEDVKDFYENFYGPNNAVLVLSGDFDIEEAKKLINKYFGEIKPKKQVKPLEVSNITLNENKIFYYEDNFAKLPKLLIAYPSVESYSKDYYALNYLVDLLNSKFSVIYKSLVEDKKIISSFSIYQDAGEIAGKIVFNFNGFENTNLDDVKNSFFESLKNFEKNGINEKEILSLKAKKELEFYQNMETVLNKSLNIAYYVSYKNDPNYYKKEIENILSVTKEDILNVYNKYIKNKNSAILSIVPKGKKDLVVKNSKLFEIKEENIQEANNNEKFIKEEKIIKTKSSFDRSIQPKILYEPYLSLPEITSFYLQNRLRIIHSEKNELPLVNFSLTINGGLLKDEDNKEGTAYLLAKLLNEGTAFKSAEEFEQALNELGASIYVTSNKEEIIINVQTLSRNFNKTISLLQELLLNPRWDNKKLELIKYQTINDLNKMEANPNDIANNILNKVFFGKTKLSFIPQGTKETLENISLDDLKKYYDRVFSPSNSFLAIVGNITKNELITSLVNIETLWQPKFLTNNKVYIENKLIKNTLYFYNLPNSKQSVIYAGYPSESMNYYDYYKNYIMNYKLGGAFTSNINLVLREEKGYTYGARTYFINNKNYSIFLVSTSVKSNTTADSLKIIKQEIESYYSKFNDDDFKFTKESILRSDSINFEKLSSYLNMLQSIGKYDLDLDYILKRQDILKNISKDEIINLANNLKNKNIVYIVVGDAKTQLEEIKELGLFNVNLVNYNGDILE
ncbi:MAG: peptidase M16 [Candidatus Sericytochromatia bacterium]|nr:MAG: peptidase M16 [Candidatus Sericytochromatia bacterium]